MDALIDGVDEVPKFSYRFWLVSNREGHLGTLCSGNVDGIPCLEDGTTLLEVGFVVGLEQHVRVLDAVESGDSVMVD
ncbi:uncharacterized protein LDX57_013040 [Aspergillus melleus]|uniref:uncharacterized protein n=1 Tax=Aspergillus melleus TaxID=138277 RepID=UPI001E8D8703|nr:uncharacterized protein LDX57_013040 [Aspergillus melleus]KAH8435410.1 hypothetical protein LDX57_013040 [Aspergillus melleus]